MNNGVSIRFATYIDAAELLRIYTPYVLKTSFTPEFKVPPLLEFEERIKQTIEFYPYLICTDNKKIVGFAHAGQYRHASGHQWSAETSVYVTQEVQGKGIAGMLYHALLTIMKLQNFVNVFAGIILPNERSIAFHQKFHFTKVGIFRNGINKSGIWHDVQWMQLALNDHVENPPLPKSIQSIMNTIPLKEIIDHVNQINK